MSMIHGGDADHRAGIFISVPFALDQFRVREFGAILL
jgi:hypothetical protein